MQDYRKSLRNNFNKTLLQIGFIMYKVDSNDQIFNKKRLDSDFLLKNVEFEKSGAFVDLRESIYR
jgi:hypothetical protein